SVGVAANNRARLDITAIDSGPPLRSACLPEESVFSLVAKRQVIRDQRRGSVLVNPSPLLAGNRQRHCRHIPVTPFFGREGKRCATYLGRIVAQAGCRLRSVQVVCGRGGSPRRGPRCDTFEAGGDGERNKRSASGFHQCLAVARLAGSLQ